MKDLEKLNVQLVRPNKFVPYVFVLPAVCGFGGWALATGAAPNIAYEDNALAVFSIRLLIASLILAPLPWLLKWDWRSQYFGSALFLFGSIALMQLFPMASIVVFSHLPRGLSWGLSLLESGLVIWWCARFVRVYRRIFADPDLWKMIYVEESDAIYYLQNVDKWVLEEKLRFNQTPTAMMFIGPMAMAFLLVLFIGPVTRFVGVPFTHIFLAVGGVPIVLWALGATTRGFLIFYYFPWKLKRATGKNVYVDMASGLGKAVPNNSV